MNKPPEFFSEIARTATLRFTEETGIQCVWEAPQDAKNIDGHVTFSFPKSPATYSVVVKSRVTREIALQPLLSKGHDLNAALLITPRLTEEMAIRCRKLGLQFIDAAGNAYIHHKDGVFIFIKGQRLPTAVDTLPLRIEQADSNTTPAALRTIFSVLANQELLNAPVRVIADAANVSVGSVAQTMNGLRVRGFIGSDGSGRTAFIDRHRLVLEWSSGFVDRLRPKLHSRYYAFDANPEMYSPGWLPDGAAWGGEPAAAILTHHLKPASFTLYADLARPELMSEIAKKLRIRTDTKGPLEIVESFWGKNLHIRDVVPPELIFADLVITGDPRNLAVADLINKKLLQNA